MLIVKHELRHHRRQESARHARGEFENFYPPGYVPPPPPSTTTTPSPPTTSALRTTPPPPATTTLSRLALVMSRFDTRCSDQGSKLNSCAFVRRNSNDRNRCTRTPIPSISKLKYSIQFYLIFVFFVIGPTWVFVCFASSQICRMTTITTTTTTTTATR
jgi:hypothetical protein